MRTALALAVLGAAAVGCWSRYDTPAQLPPSSASGRAPRAFVADRACDDWDEAVGGDEDAHAHVTYPELDARGCFVTIDYRDGPPRAGPVSAACTYPPTDAPSHRDALSHRDATVAHLRAEAARYERVAGGDERDVPFPIACPLPEGARGASARVNARTLRRLARRLSEGRTYAYAAASTFGFGYAPMSDSALVSWRPDEACVELDKREMELFSVNRIRAFRAAEVQLSGIAPVVTVSGGAVHADLVEAFMLAFLASCQFGVPREAILLDPCARHTHENLRNTGALIRTLGARTAYVVTDDGIQSDYLQDWTFFSLVLGDLDQRSLRDFGHLLGSWRQASIGMRAGFWFTPYRFWGDDHYDQLTCVPR